MRVTVYTRQTRCGNWRSTIESGKRDFSGPVMSSSIAAYRAAMRAFLGTLRRKPQSIAVDHVFDFTACALEVRA